MKKRLLLAVLLACLPVAASAALDVDEPMDFIWSTGTVTLVSQKGHSAYVRALALFPDGRRLATGSDDRTIRVWDLTERRSLLILRAESAVVKLAISSDGTRILSLDDEGMAWLWDASSGKVLTTFKTPQYTNTIAFTPDGKRAVTTAMSAVLFTDLDDVTKRRSVPLLPPIDFSKSYDSDDTYAYGVSVSPDASRGVSCTKKNVRIVDLETGAFLKTWPIKTDHYNCAVALSPDDKLLLTGSVRDVRLRDADTGAEIARIKLDGGKWTSVSAMEFSRDGKRFEVHANGFAVYDTATRRVLHELSYGVLSDDGTKLYQGGYSGDVSVTALTPGAPSSSDIGRAAETAFVRVAPDMSDGHFVFYGDGMTPELFELTNKAHRDCTSDYGATGFDHIARCLKSMQTVGLDSAEVPAAPVLTRDAYESQASFDARVAAAKNAYEAALAERARKRDAWKRPVMALPVTFLTSFQSPAIKDVAYDPETRLFHFVVYPTGLWGGGYKLRLVMRDLVPNDQAPAFERQLASATPTVSYRVRDGEFTLEGVRVQLGTTTVPAYPSDETVRRELARVDIGEVVQRPVDPAAPAVSAGYSENPELLAKQNELAAARKKAATAEQLAKLTEEIRQLTQGDARRYDSDVDADVAARPEDPAALAVVVGVESYQNDDLPKARFAERDARSVARRLTALGVAPRNMKVLVGSDATRSKLASVLEQWLPQRASAGSKVYFYFSGHGAPDPVTGDSYLVPWDGDPALLKGTGYPLAALYAALAKVPASRRVALLDSCFSGAGERSLLAKGARPLVNVRETSAGDVTVLAAASASQITASLESQGHGLFTYHLLKSLGAGGRAASAVYAELKPRVQDEAARQNREQTPAFSGPDAPIP